jgi:predicted esterase
LHDHSEYNLFKIGYFGVGTGAASALKTAAQLESIISGVVSLSGRTDLVHHELSLVKCPVLLIAGELDFQGVKMNQKALKKLGGPKQLAVISGASHLFEESKKLEEAKHITGSWFHKFLPTTPKGKWLQHK